MAEINPLVETKEGEVIALDAKMNFDQTLYLPSSRHHGTS